MESLGHALDDKNAKGALVGKGIIIPVAFGLATARAGLSLLVPGDFGFSNTPISAEFADARSLSLVAVLLVLLAFGKCLPSHTVLRIQQASIATMTVCLCVLLANRLYFGSEALGTVASFVGSLFGIMALFFWFRKLRGSSPFVIMASIGAGRILCEALVTLVHGNDVAGYLVGIAAVLLQIVPMRLTRNCRPTARPSSFGTNAFGFDSSVKDARFILVMVLALLFLTTASLMLRIYPEGQTIPLSSGQSIASLVILTLLIAGCVLLARFASPLALLLGMWLLIALLSSVVLVIYALFPNDLGYGAILTVASNTLKNTFKWYLIIAFISIGEREPYIYASCIWLLFLVPRMVCDTLMSLIQSCGTTGTALLDAFISLCITVSSTLLIAGMAANLRPHEHKSPDEPSVPSEEKASPLMDKLLGISDAQQLHDLRELAMEESVAAMGRQFLLSDREMQIAKLYALGHTQGAIADALFISKTTVHAHIRHIYEKTNLHSRQALIDYLRSGQ